MSQLVEKTRVKMRTVEGRRFVNIFLIGAALTLLVLLASASGLLDPMERFFYDARVRYCQFFTPPPSGKIVHIDIDDGTTEAVGAWPWRRAKFAQMLEEIRLAEPKAVFLDILFTDPSPFNTPGTEDDDAVLAEQFKKMGNVILPVTLTGGQYAHHSPRLMEWLLKLLHGNLDMTEAEAFAAWEKEGLWNGMARETFTDAYVETQRLLIQRYLLSYGGRLLKTDLAKARLKILPWEKGAEGTPLARMLEKEFRKARAVETLRTLTIPSPHGTVDLNVPAPLELFGREAVGTAFVDYRPDPDGIFRAIPLLSDERFRMYPQAGLALACNLLGADLRSLRWDDDGIALRLDHGIPPAELFIPLDRGKLLVPWFGPKDDGWTRMYDPAGKSSSAHIPMKMFWERLQLRERIEHNNRAADQAIHTFYDLFAPEKWRVYSKDIPPLDDTNARNPVIRDILADREMNKMIEEAIEAGKNGEELDENTRLLITRYEQLQTLEKSNAELAKQLSESQTKLREALRGKAVLIGWTATAVAADFVPTSLHAKVPGVVVHGTILNGILTGDLWRRAPRWVGLLVGLSLGLAVATAVALLSPVYATLVTAALAVGYLLFNSIVLFDYGNVVLDLASPELAVGLIWAGCVAYRYIDERLSRARITARFRSYVDPTLVDYVINNPTRTTLAGEVREMTVVFTDLAGFTTLSEKLGEQTVPLLNEYLGLMVPVIRHRKGYVNKFLGDGIMFFFNAPLANPTHARDAVLTVLEMQSELERFNKTLAERGLPAVKMRSGILSGEMVVGDAGSLAAPNPEDRASDFTVLGDRVNLASRLEGANKATGTLTLLAERTVELLNGELLVRPIARLQVVGKSEGVMTYEPLALAAEATVEQKKLADMTRAMVDLYTAKKFFECLTAADELDKEFGASKLAELYRKSCRIYLVEPPEHFHGEIVLTEK